MEQLNDYILDAIITLRQKQKQPNKDSILNILTSKTGSIAKAKSDSQLNELVKQQRIYNKNLLWKQFILRMWTSWQYSTYRETTPIKTPLEPSTVSLESPKDPLKISSAIPLETPLTEPLKPPKNPHTPQLFSDFCRELNLTKDHIKTLETGNEAIKLFIKEQLYALKKSISDIKNERTVNENAKLIEYLQKANQKLEQENDSKTTIIKILAKNNTSNIPTTQSNTEQFKLVKRKTNHKSYKLKNERKPEIKYSNGYETLYITDSEKESNMNDEWWIDNPNDESTTPEYSSDNPAFRKRRKSKP